MTTMKLVNTMASTTTTTTTTATMTMTTATMMPLSSTSPSANLTDNLTEEELMIRLVEKMNIRAIGEDWLIGLLLSYLLLITMGALGNGLVVMAVARNPAMRTARNIYIINLAISDLILCLFTMPFSLVEILLKFWPLGLVTCKLVAGLEAASIFVSTISIMAIAIDRYKVILYPTREPFNPLTGFLMVAVIWLIALALATPLFIYRTVFTHEVPHKSLLLKYGLQTEVDYCVENWPHNKGRYVVGRIIAVAVVVGEVEVEVAKPSEINDAHTHRTLMEIHPKSARIWPACRLHLMLLNDAYWHFVIVRTERKDVGFPWPICPRFHPVDGVQRKIDRWKTIS